MKKTLLVSISLVALFALFGALALAGCGGSDGGGKAPSLVSIAITGAPTTYATGAALNLGGLVVTLTYSDASTTPIELPAGTVIALDAAGSLTTKVGSVTVTVSGYNPAGTGEQTITVTVDGKTQQFTITVTGHVPVTGLTLTSTTAVVGTPLTLAATVTPTDATNKTIVWSVKAAGTTGASISSGVLSASSAGTATVTAIIANGLTATTAYTQDFDITVTTAPLDLADNASYDIPAGTVSAGISPVTIGAATGGTAPYSYAVSGNPAWISFNATTREISGTRPAAEEAAGSFTITVTDSATPAATASITVAYGAVSIPVPADLTITVGVDQGVVTIGRSDGAETPIVLSKGGTPNTLTLSATGFTDSTWLLDGDTATPIGTEGSITINASGYAVKKHSITFTGWKGATFYTSDPIDFSVQN
ncbi:putative Ig domain-containing protein [Treponema primitia]|uniref:putative Ig domain-containing protein n=1 Tax=Treponema primitia TaxID=88058 RepID=UPI0002555430|nr:putative Ig domain-containing protein [Treponema primitia]